MSEMSVRLDGAVESGPKLDMIVLPPTVFVLANQIAAQGREMSDVLSCVYVNTEQALMTATNGFLIARMPIKVNADVARAAGSPDIAIPIDVLKTVERTFSADSSLAFNPGADGTWTIRGFGYLDRATVTFTPEPRSENDRIAKVYRPFDGVTAGTSILLDPEFLRSLCNLALQADEFESTVEITVGGVDHVRNGVPIKVWGGRNPRRTCVDAVLMPIVGPTAADAE